MRIGDPPSHKASVGKHKIMTHQEIRKKFKDFFENRNHKWVESSSLLPTDPSVLFTTAGMQQFKPYYTGELDPEKTIHPGLREPVGKNAASIQKCIRTSDIDEVGDKYHLTFFEMLGNFSFGGYDKEKAIQLAYEFITSPDWMDLKIDYVTIFEDYKSSGLEMIRPDEKSKEIWKKLGLKDEQIKTGGFEDNFWGPIGDEGPCGPTTEIYVGGVEIWNIVFNEYHKTKDSDLYLPLQTKGIDTGMGLERLATVLQNKSTIFETDLLEPVFKKTPSDMNLNVRGIITDHIRAIVFLISDGVIPSNKDQGYILRRLMRRVMAYSYLYFSLKEPKENETFNYEDLARIVCENYNNIYTDLDFEKILEQIRFESVKFNKALDGGVAELKLFYNKFTENNIISGKGLGLELFKIYESRGLHPDIARDILKQWGLTLDKDIVAEYNLAIQEAHTRHQEISRAGAEKKFGGHGLLLDTGELKAGNKEELAKVTRLHTATHLLHAALRKVLGEEIHQAGSDITAERLRFDFTFSRKMTTEEIKKVEDLVNEIIAQDLPVTMQEMPYEEAIKKGALAFFKLKYPPIVKVYTVGSDNAPFSRELCGGPHVTNTDTIGKFKIAKEESISSGTRRIRAIVE